MRDHTRKMSFDEIYYPGMPAGSSNTDKILSDYRAQLFGAAPAPGAAPGGAADPEGLGDGSADPGVLPATALGRAAWQALVHGGWEELSRQYVFDVRPLTNDRPYFAAYIKPSDLGKFTTAERLAAVQTSGAIS